MPKVFVSVRDMFDAAWRGDPLEEIPAGIRDEWEEFAGLVEAASQEAERLFDAMESGYAEASDRVAGA